MTPRWKQRLGGLLLMLVGGGVTAWMWYTTLTQGSYPKKASMFFPAVCVVGLGLLLFPGYKEERLARGEAISQLSGARLLTPRWRVTLVLALIAGVVNHLLLAAQVGP